MCRVNKICCSCSQEVLYREIQCDSSISKCIYRTLAQRNVRSFSSRFNGSDMAMALWNMTSLRILKLLCSFHLYILDGCTFKLDSFACNCVRDRNESFQKFLNRQRRLKYVTLPVYFGSEVASSLKANCLPNLTRINATFPWLPYLIPGRPLNEVISDGCTENEHSIDLSSFALSTTPIQKLSIDYSHLYLTPGHLLASFLPSLTHFTLTVFNRLTVFKHEGVCALSLY